MLKKSITYEDLFSGGMVTEDFYFHLSQAELVEIEMSHKGGLSEALKKIIATEDGKVIIAEFKNIILKAYGVRSANGSQFIKNEQLREEFAASEAYSVLFMELVTNAGVASDFINGIIPAKLVQEAAKVEEATRRLREGTPPALTQVPPLDTPEQPEEVKSENGEPEPAPEVISRQELSGKSDEELQPIWERVKSGELVIGD